MRITGGTHRSRALVAPRGQATRPTSDRVREALFSILAARGAIEGARVLDLYAGTGALALEALSRGAARATLVEKGREALAALRANVAALELEGRADVIGAPVERAAAGLSGGGFELVLVDPPYAEVTGGDALRAVERVVAAGALADGAIVVLEHAPARGGGGAPKPEPKDASGREGGAEEARAPAIAGLTHEVTRRYGDTCLSFYSAPVAVRKPE